MLIGEAGVGKSAIIEGLALRIVQKSVPHVLLHKRIFSLDVSSLVAGTKYRGQFEERINALLKELSGSDVILFIDEIHTIVGAGSTQGSLDTANILKPALARGELQCIGATTMNEYRENIEADSALERRFQKIVVEQPSAEQTLHMLRNIRSQYESHHCVRYTDEALSACVGLTRRYVTDRFFPDKAIDVMDEAGSRARAFDAQVPESLKLLEQEIEQAAGEKNRAIKMQNYRAGGHAPQPRGGLAAEAAGGREAVAGKYGPQSDRGRRNGYPRGDRLDDRHPAVAHFRRRAGSPARHGEASGRRRDRAGRGRAQGDPCDPP